MASNWMPGAKKMPVTWAQNLSRLGTKPRLFVMHVAAANWSGQQIHDYFQRNKNACSHFYVDEEGNKFQFQPISAKSGADYGVRHTVSCETEGLGDGPWTKAQLVSLAEIYVWLHEEWGFQMRMSETSNGHGLATHRHGCDGNFPSSGVQRGRLQRNPLGPKMSGSRGKICPGYDRQGQYPTVFSMAQALNEGKDAIDNTKPKPKPENNEELVSVDGKWGKDTTDGLQFVLKHKGLYKGVEDGEIDSQNARWKADNPGLTLGWHWLRANYKGSKTIVGLQELIGMSASKRDGLIGPGTIKALQKWLKKKKLYTGKIDGKMDKPSRTIKGLQRYINAQIKIIEKKGK